MGVAAFISGLYQNRLYRKDWEAVTSGSVNIYAVRYQFSADWDGLTKTAVFRADGVSVNVPLDGGNGTCGADTVLPTIWLPPDGGFTVLPVFGSTPSKTSPRNNPSVPGPQGPPGPPGADGSPGVTMEAVNAAIQQAITGAIEEAY